MKTNLLGFCMALTFMLFQTAQVKAISPITMEIMDAGVKTQTLLIETGQQKLFTAHFELAGDASHPQPYTNVGIFFVSSNQVETQVGDWYELPGQRVGGVYLYKTTVEFYLSSSMNGGKIIFKYIDSGTKTYPPSFKVFEIPTLPSNATPFLRYYNPTKADHLYTIIKTEEPVGYNFEGIEAFVLTSSASGTAALNRYYNPSTGDHYYSIVPNENPVGYIFERIEAYIYTSATTGTVPLYRYTNNTNHEHYYSTIPNENPAGYTYEGIQGYVIKARY